MKFITVSNEYFELNKADSEMLLKGNRRPHVLLVTMKYKGHKYDFAVPFRSNIPPGTPNNQYFSLPPRATTKPGHRHGLHYIKMFPITKQYQEKYWVGNNQSYILYQQIIEKNQKQIIKECQEYLRAYEENGKPNFAVDIDAALQRLGLNPASHS